MKRTSSSLLCRITVLLSSSVDLFDAIGLRNQLAGFKFHVNNIPLEMFYVSVANLTTQLLN